MFTSGKLFQSLLFGILLCCYPESTKAASLANLTPTTLAVLTNGSVEELIRTIGTGFDHRPYRQATPLGYKLGFDIGAEIAAIQISDKLKSTIEQLGAASDIPIYIPYAKLNVGKGLPWGIDLSGSYVGYKRERVYGFGAQWSFLRNKAETQGIAVRAAMNDSNLFIIKARTYSADLVVSKRILWMFNPYIGVGYQHVIGELDLATNTTIPGLPSSVSSDYEGGFTRVFLGLPIQLLILRMVAHIEYSDSGVYQGGLKIGFNL